MGRIQDMQIGALTACAPGMTLEEWVQAAVRMKLNGLEIAAHAGADLAGRKDWIANTLGVEAGQKLSKTRASEIASMFGEKNLEMYSLGVYENMLLLNEKGAFNRQRLIDVIDAAAELGIGNVSTFAGAHPKLNMQENLELFKQVYIPLLEHAKEKGVILNIENCPMEGWEESDRPVNNIMCSPLYWRAVFDMCEKAGVGDYIKLEYDPSHRLWEGGFGSKQQGNKAIAEDMKYLIEAGKLGLLHGKGAELLPEKARQEGISGRLISLAGNDWAKRGCYEHAVPGADYDDVNWKPIINAGRKAKVKVINIEIEDPRYKDMKDAKHSGELGLQAVALARKNLAPLAYANGVSYVAPKKAR